MSSLRSYRFVLFELLVSFVSLAVAGADELSTDWGTDSCQRIGNGLNGWEAQSSVLGPQSAARLLGC